MVATEVKKKQPPNLILVDIGQALGTVIESPAQLPPNTPLVPGKLRNLPLKPAATSERPEPGVAIPDKFPHVRKS